MNFTANHGTHDANDFDWCMPTDVVLRAIDHNLASAMSRYVQATEIDKSGSCHIFRHTMATQMNCARQPQHAWCQVF